MPKISEETRRSYAAKQAFAVRVAGARSFQDMVAHPARSVDKLRAHYGASVGTLRQVLTAVLAGARSMDQAPEWRRIHAAISREVAAHKHGVLTPEMAAKYVCWEKIVAAARAARGHATLAESLETVLLAMVTALPPKRADFGDLSVNGKDGNRLVLPSRGDATLILTEFKTAKTHGELTERCPARLTAVVRTSLRAWPRSRLFVTADGRAMSPNAYGAFVRKTMLRHVGKPVGLTMLRHIYISDVVLRSDPKTPDAAAAASMLHSKKQQRGYLVLRGDGTPVCPA